MKVSKSEKQEAIDRLKGWINPGDTVYTVLRHVSKSGMMREISVYIMVDNSPLNITGYVSRILETSIGNHDGIRQQGCGMDMGFALVYDLSWHLFNENSPKDAGYSLRHSWM